MRSLSPNGLILFLFQVLKADILEVYRIYILLSLSLYLYLMHTSYLLCICSLTGGMGTTGLNTPVGIPAVSILGAAPAAAPVLRPTVPGLGSIPGATLPITPSIELAPPSECLLLKNMFDPALEVRVFFTATLVFYAKSLNCYL